MVRQFGAFIRRRGLIALVAVSIAAVLGTLYLLTTPPMFTGVARIILDSRKVQLFQQQSVLGDVPADSATVESQVEILKSDVLALVVLKELGFLDDPEFAGTGGGIVRNAIKFVANFFGSRDEDEEARSRRAVRTFKERISVRRVGLTFVIEIEFRSFDPDRAARIANGLADGYIVDQMEAKYQATRRASTWLQDRIRELREQASSAERAVVEFKVANNIVETGGRLINEQQLSELNSQLVQARAKVSENRARLDRIDQIVASGAPEGTMTDSLRNEVVSKLRSQYLELANREADWSARYGRNHLAAVDLRNRMREIQRAITDELRRLAETYKNDYEIARQREEAVTQELADAVSRSQTTNAAQVKLRELESNAQTYRTLYDNFLQRYTEAIQQQSFPMTEARVISRATRPPGKSSPQPYIVLPIAAFAGLFVGLGLGFLMDLSDRTFRTSQQVEEALRANVLASLPVVKGKPAPETTGSAGDRAMARSDHPLWSAVDSPFSRFAEGLRSIKLAADLAISGSSGRIIGLTSTLPNEGKSTVAGALAHTIAQAGSRVILLDCDLRNPRLSREFAPAAPIGIVDVVTGAVPLREAVWVDPQTKLTFLPSVATARSLQTHEILSSRTMKTLFDELRTLYDYVIVDFSPLVPVVDVRATTHLVDGYVMVVEWGRTDVENVEQALNSAPGIYQNLLGVVLNKVDTQAMRRFEGASAEQSRKYYAQYGYTE